MSLRTGSSSSEFRLPADHEFIEPKKAIKGIQDMSVWQKSEAYFEYFGFIMAINDAVKGKAIDSKYSCSSTVNKVCELLNKFDQWINEIPPTEQPQRFGNKSFRIWHEKLLGSAVVELNQILPENLYPAIPEIVQYLLEGFGNATRIDYGTGHEMAFIMFLCCMFKINAFESSDKTAVGLKIFNRYLEVVRKLQLTYRMEPAGSHGVWSLDDYQFVPFIWGSSQLIGHPRMEPQHFTDHGLVEANSRQYMFLGCIEFISKVKTGPFAEHSNQLWNVSAVSSWSKVNSGLIRMYKAEVLTKFPVIQHVLFGSLFSTKPVPDSVTFKAPQPPGSSGLHY
ncbi:PREDICTED: serine/threonine-protein phosphatase 2A activator-like [Ceratosolen solmsi marchali]|uniref:Serine/threonine-protein phosphatase 2A activator n=1 Tax=Ceratosolen solmsi marchali TaxID=326594 RepID=A0AAJ6YY32_9HYME|nr:PREDICTED: serine/threonine-protein phosphatase 2A activator-like [Ceratosolen solmsi marchali]